MKKFITSTLDENLAYFDTSAWFAGVVESISDPTQAGRVQVRCIGYHPDDKSLVPTMDLPWAHVMLPTTSAGLSGIGATHGLLEGSWVIGFFSDGREAQQPIVIGTIPGNPKASRNQQTLLNNNQSIQESGTEAVGGLIQSTPISNITSSTNSGLAPSASDLTSGIDLSTLQNLVSNGIDVYNPTQKNILSALGTASDLQVSQLYTSISNNEKLSSNSSGSSLLSYVKSYSDASLASLLGITSSDTNISSKNKTIDVSTNYEKALTTTTEAAGSIFIENNGLRKAQAAAPISSFKNLSQYAFVITSQGEIYPKDSLSSSSDSSILSSVTNLGTTLGTVRICLIGGYPDDPKYDNTAGFNDRYTVQQFNALKRLLTVILKKYPKAIIVGDSSVSKGSSAPGFNVTTAFSDIFPNNINSTGSSPIITTDSTVPSSVDTSSYTSNRAFQDPRGLYPSTNYGQDYSLLGRTNSYTTGTRTPQLIKSIKGNLTKFANNPPRDASNRTAVSNIDPKSLNIQDWGGEYGLAHVVHETPAGHGLYMDDTPGKERTLLHSASGSLIDLGADGSTTLMSQGESKHLVDKDFIEVINGSSFETVNGSKHIKIASDLIIEVGGKLSIMSKDSNEFVIGNKKSLIEGFKQEQAKAGYQLNVGRDYISDVGGNRTDVTVGSNVNKTGTSRLDVITGTHTIKSNYSVDVTLGNRVLMTKGNLQLGSNGSSSIYSKSAMSLSSSTSLSAATSGDMSLDGAHIKMQEGSTSVPSYTYPDTLQPIASTNDSESNPSATDFTFGPRQEMEAHDEGGNNTGSSRSAFNSGSTRNSNSPIYSNGGSKTDLNPIGLGSSAGDGCTIAKGLVDRGMTPEAASAYAGGFMQESSLNPGTTNSIGAYGLAQWTNSGNRKGMMLNYLGDRAGTIDGQLDYVMHELQNNPNGVAGGAATTWKTNDLNDAIKSAALYERFNGFQSASQGIFTGNEWGKRAGYATSIYQDCFGKTVSGSTGSSLNSSSNANGPNTGVGSGPDQRGAEKDQNLPPLTDKYTDRNQKISEFFVLGDLLQSGGHQFELQPYYDLPNGRVSADEIVANISRNAVNVLDVIYRRLGKVTILSGLRPPAYNRAIGGARNSMHQYGLAADIVVAGYTPSQVHEYVKNNIPACKGLGSYATFTHVDSRPQSYRSTWSG